MKARAARAGSAPGGWSASAPRLGRPRRAARRRRARVMRGCRGRGRSTSAAEARAAPGRRGAPRADELNPRQLEARTRRRLVGDRVGAFRRTSIDRARRRSTPHERVCRESTPARFRTAKRRRCESDRVDALRRSRASSAVLRSRRSTAVGRGRGGPPSIARCPSVGSGRRQPRRGGDSASGCHRGRVPRGAIDARQTSGTRAAASDAKLTRRKSGLEVPPATAAAIRRRAERKAADAPANREERAAGRGDAVEERRRRATLLPAAAGPRARGGHPQGVLIRAAFSTPVDARRPRESRAAAADAHASPNRSRRRVASRAAPWRHRRGAAKEAHARRAGRRGGGWRAVSDCEDRAASAQASRSRRRRPDAPPTRAHEGRSTTSSPGVADGRRAWDEAIAAAEARIANASGKPTLR